jgi:uncharacterized membrane protein YecN with MAPEG domain
MNTLLKNENLNLRTSLKICLYYILSVTSQPISILLPFWFLRGRYKESFPIVSCRQQMRIAVKFRSYEQLVRSCRGFRESCQQIPSGLSVAGAVDSSGNSIPIRYLSGQSIAFNNVRLLTYSSIVDGPIRDNYIKKPFEVLYRELNTFNFDQPLKYSVIKN